MFLSTNSLNEGGIINSRSELRKRLFFEGENPKSGFNPVGWQASKEKCHVNSNWQKLRK